MSTSRLNPNLAITLALHILARRCGQEIRDTVMARVRFEPRCGKEARVRIEGRLSIS
jgi:hypothetical protein